jgi:polyisoprenoid-binding protein YceI
MKRFVLCLALACLTSTVSAETYVVDGLDPVGDSVLFQSTAKLEFIQGATSAISGSIVFNPSHTADSINGKLQVDLRTLKTGIEMRDEHMRTRHLETDKFPFAYFELTAVKGLREQMVAGVACTCSAEGYFYIHGVKHKITPTVEIVDNSTGVLKSVQVRARFSLNLDEWKIPRPKALFLKLAETINVDVRFAAHVGKPAPAITLPDWPDN